MYDVSKLLIPHDCRTVMARAKQRGMQGVYTAVFKRYWALVGNENDDPSDPLVRDFYETLAAYEQLLTEKNGSTTIASRTRQKVANEGVHQSLVEWTRGKIETNGFLLLVEAGLPEFTGEYLVTKYADRFPADIVTLARGRLVKHGISLASMGQKSLSLPTARIAVASGAPVSVSPFVCSWRAHSM
jgi:hypothetical protein